MALMSVLPSLVTTTVMEKNSSLKMTKFRFLVQCLLLSFFIAAATSTASATISSDQLEALLAMKAQVTDDPTNFFAQNWNTNTGICNWTGVSCDERSHRVTSLNISNLDLAGTIPSQLGNLSSLQSLDLSFNRLSGAIPSSIFSLNSLKYIRLRNNQLSGALPADICNHLPFLEWFALSSNRFHGGVPTTLSKCKHLRVLALAYNEFSGPLPREIGNLTQLTELYLGNNNFQGSIPRNWRNLNSLKRLFLAGSNLSGTIPSDLGNLSSTQYLDLRSNRFSGEIPHELGNLAELEMLYLSNNLLTGTVPLSVCNLTSLLDLDLSHNNLTGSFSDDMCRGAPLLQQIDMSSNRLTGPIPESLWQCKGLVLISLSYNQFTGTIPRFWGNLTSLIRLYLAFNNLIGEIPYEIGNLRSLKVLGLGQNKLVGVLPFTIFNISTLQVLEVHNNYLRGRFPSTADVRLPNLIKLYLWGNNFSGSIPNFIFNASYLTLISLKTNSFSGFIPNTFGNLRYLKWLSLQDNLLTSSTPKFSFLSSLSNCKNLKRLELNGNPLDGTLPRSVGNLSHSLERFSMGDCNISGGIPEEVSNLFNLIFLDLGGNKLSGSIPAALAKLQKLQVLYLRDNKFEGAIPKDLCSLAALSELNLGGNKLSGSIPACFGDLSSLRKLSLASNNLNSTIPSIFWNLQDILYLNLSSNFFTGPLPREIGSLKVLVELNLSMNNFSGFIPTTIGYINSLQYLSLGYNRLQGPIPSSFDHLLSLITLDLACNNLSGSIPVSLEKLEYLKYLNLSFNRLEGEIPRKGSFRNFTASSFVGNNLLCGSSNLQVRSCKNNKTPRKLALLLGIVLPVSIALVVVCILALRFVLNSRSRMTQMELLDMPPQPSTTKRISYLELVRATDGFSESNLIGTGGFGSVYRATFEDGIEVVVKHFHVQSERACKSFDIECEVMKNIRHRNLVKVVSSCSNEDFRALILEYMPNGSLENHLYSGSCILDIFQRLNIMIDVASALEYLHFGSANIVIHCDIKPSNILLDDCMVARLGDFGIAKLLSGDDQSMIRTQTLATIGYMAPEYGREGQVTTKGDVYSFGISLMEAFTRKKPTDEIFTDELSLRRWVQDSLSSLSVMNVVDASILSLEDIHFASKEQCVLSVFNLALECTEEAPEKRTNAAEISRRLVKIRDSLLRMLRADV